MKMREFPVGPWTNEPNRKEWKHAGFNCLINRGPMGNLCGYVGLPPMHPLHGKDYSWEDDNPVNELSVHGGITYAAECHGEICHKPAPGETEHLWWLGFDCAHAGDSVPGMMQYTSFRDGSYKDIVYVTQETNSLAEQLAAMSNPMVERIAAVEV